MLTQEQVQKFISIYKTRFGVDITPEEALEKGTKLLRLVQLIYKPMTEEEMRQLQKRRKETEDRN